MLNGVLEIAAYCSLAVAVGLLILKLLWPRLGPRVEVRRFKHRLGKADRVLAQWADEFKARDENQRHEQRHPHTTDD